MTRRPDLVVHVGVGASRSLLASAVPLLAAELARHGVRTSDPGTVPPVGSGPVSDGLVSAGPVLVLAADDPPVPVDPSDAWAFCSLQRADVARVVAAAGARRARVVLCPERQDRLLERSYLTAVAGGFAGSLDELFPRRFEPLLDYRPLLTELRAVPDVVDVQVLPVELVAAGASAYVGAVLSALDTVHPLDLAGLAGWQVPREYTPKAARIATAMAPHLETERERAWVRDFVLATFSMPAGSAPALLPGPDRARILEAYRPINRAFFADVPGYPAAAYGGRPGLRVLQTRLPAASTTSPMTTQ